MELSAPWKPKGPLASSLGVCYNVFPRPNFARVPKQTCDTWDQSWHGHLWVILKTNHLWLQEKG